MISNKQGEINTAPPSFKEAGTMPIDAQALVVVAEGARNRYGYRYPVYLSSKVFEQCVLVQPNERCENRKRSEDQRLFNILARAKYAIRHARQGATMTDILLKSHDPKRGLEDLVMTAMIFIVDTAKPALLIKLAEETFLVDNDSQMSNWATGLGTIQEAI